MSGVPELTTMGLIIGNRGFFPDHLAQKGREDMIAALRENRIEAVVLGPEDSKYGAVETREEAKKSAASDTSLGNPSLGKARPKFHSPNISAGTCSTSSVKIGPGAMLFTYMLTGPSSRANF